MARESSGPRPEDARAAREAHEEARQEVEAKRVIKSEQDRLAFGKPTAELEWDGIRKLDMPPPRWWVLTFWACFLFAVALVGALPVLAGNTGLLPGPARLRPARRRGRADRGRRGRARRDAGADRCGRAARAGPADAELLQYASGRRRGVRQQLRPLPWAGRRRAGLFPTLADDDWIWGGTLADIEHTIPHGVRNGGEEARDSQMPAFGADQILTRDRSSTWRVCPLAHRPRRGRRGCRARRGAVRRELRRLPRRGRCRHAGAGCARAERRDLALWRREARHRAPDPAPRHGVMPAFGGRLDDPTINMLAIYVHALGGGR